MQPPPLDSVPLSSSPSPASAPIASPATEPLRRPVPRPFLERVGRALLVRLLAPYASLLVERFAFPFAALSASAQIDRVQVSALWDLLSTAPPELSELRDDLLAIADAATHAGHEVLARDGASVLDPDLGAEDCAATAYLDHRAIFERARPQTAGQAQTKSFASFRASAGRALPRDPACAATFIRRMREELVLRSRSDHFHVHEWRSGAERHFEIVYGKLVSARDVIGKAQAGGPHEITAQVTDRATERTHAVFHEDTRDLDIAGYDWMKELIRRNFGEAYFGSEAHFQANETVTLAPLAALDVALSSEGIPALRKVELQEIWIDLGGDDGAWVAAGARSDTTKGAAAGYALRAIGEGKGAEAVFLLHLASRTRPVKLKIALPRKLEFDRRDPRVVRIVRDWCVARGFITMPNQEPAGNGTGRDPAPGATDAEPS
jgi:hypothetical protein